MFTEFENMFRKQTEKLTKSAPLDLLGGNTSSNVWICLYRTTPKPLKNSILMADKSKRKSFWQKEPSALYGLLKTPLQNNNLP